MSNCYECLAKFIHTVSVFLIHRNILNMKLVGRTLLLLGILHFSSGILLSQTWNWAKRFGGSGSDFGLKQVIDASGNIFTFSVPVTSVNFGSGPVSTHGNSDILVTKHDATGQLQWYTLIGGTQADNGGDIVLDPTGNIYVCGNFRGTMITGSDTLVASNDDICVVKLDPNGQTLWGRKAGSSASGMEAGFSIAYSSVDNSLVITGMLSGMAAFGSYTVTNSGCYIAKIDTSGNWLWAYGTNPALSGIGQAVEVGVNGAIYLSSTTGATMHLKKFNSSGSLIWDVAASAGNTTGWEICFDQLGHLYVVGRNVQGFSFGAVYVPPALNSQAGFLIQCDTSGNANWALDFQSSSIYTSSLTVTNSGDVLVGGMFSTTLYVDTTIIADIYNGGLDGYVAKISPTGSVIWIKQIGTLGQDHVYGLTYWNGKICFTGIVGGTVNGNFWPLVPANGYGSLDIVVSQFNDCSPPTSQVVPSAPFMVCEGDSIHLQSSNTNPAYTYQWQANGVPLVGQTGTSLDIVANPLYSGGYAIQVSSGGCTYTSTYIPVTINSLPVVLLSTTTYSVNCVLDSVRLNSTNLPLHSYQWLQKCA